MSVGDETFTRFRRKLADVVTVAINSGREVSARGGLDCYCPIGCFGDPTNRKPPPGHVRPFLDFTLPNFAPTAFTEGFDGRKMSIGVGFVDAYYELGRLYRARFP